MMRTDKAEIHNHGTPLISTAHASVETDDALRREMSVSLKYDVPVQAAYPVSMDILVDKGSDRVRLIPCNGSSCMVGDIRFSYRGTAVEYGFIDGFYMGSMVWFPNEKAQFVIKLPDEGGHILHVEMTIRLYDSINSILQSVISEYDKTDEQYEKLYTTSTQEIMRLKKENEAIGRSFEIVMNSTAWKVTWPMRKVTDGLKYLIRKSPRIHGVFNRYSLNPQRLFQALKMMRSRLSSAPVPTSALNLDWPDDAELERQRGQIFPRDIKFSILVPLYNTPGRFLREMIASVQRQSYGNWELCLADGSDAKHPEVEHICMALSSKDARIKYRHLPQNLGISGNTNACIDMATGDFIALFDHDDLLHPSALYEMMKVICEKDADFVYTDETTFISPNRRQIGSTHYKPDFSPDNLLANNYICHFTAFDARLLEVAGRFRSEYDGSQDHDLFLRLTHAARRIEHIPKVLYWWRSHPMSVAQDIGAKQYAVDAGRNAVKDFLHNYRHVDAEVTSTEAFPTIFRIDYPLMSQDKVSIVITDRDRPNVLKRCVNAIISNTHYENYEIVIVDHGSTNYITHAYYNTLEGIQNVRFLKTEDEKVRSKLINWAVTCCKGQYIVLMDEDVEVINPEWLENMLMYAQREDVGAVGPKISLPSGKVQQAGIILNPDSEVVAMMGHHHVDAGNFGYMGRLYYAQDVSAVSAACMMIRRDRYLAAGGMDETFAAAFYDVDLCLRLRRKGFLNIYTPFAELRRPDDPAPDEAWIRDRDAFRQRWADVLASGDPYYNPNFKLNDTTFDFIVYD